MSILEYSNNIAYLRFLRSQNNSLTRGYEHTERAMECRIKHAPCYVLNQQLLFFLCLGGILDSPEIWVWNSFDVMVKVFQSLHCSVSSKVDG